MKQPGYALLEVEKLQAGTPYYHPENQPEVVNLDSPALDVLTDFKSRPPACISADKTIHEALAQMKIEGVKSLLVTEGEEDIIIGLISARDIQGARPGIIAQQNGINLSEVTVRLAMIPVEDIYTINLEYLSNARVGHIVRLLEEKHINYLLVVEHLKFDSGEIVRGIFSASRIGRQLDAFVGGDLSSGTLADINKRI